jgi:hypothetical protein
MELSLALLLPAAAVTGGGSFALAASESGSAGKPAQQP